MPSNQIDPPDGVAVLGPVHDRYDQVLTPAALSLLAALHRSFDGRRRELLAARRARAAELAAGGTLDFLAATKDVRADESWQVAEPAPGLIDRRVEITGPTDRKMTVNALNSGAKVWLADHEDANTPLWENMVGGQLNLRDAILREIDFTSPEGKSYALADEVATIVVRPRGWHLDEKHVTVDGEPVSGSLFDFALYLFHCGPLQVQRGLGPYFYLPKLESHLEARLWNDVFLAAQEHVDMPRGTIRATVLIETFPAAFEMDEILHELREHSAGLNAGRWDYMFSVIKSFHSRGRDFLLPDRNSVTMTVPFMRAYTELLVRTCHKRGAHAIGGMAAFIPSKDEQVNAAAYAKVADDKKREATDGFDGSWVAHPGMVATCREAFDAVLGDRPDQRDRRRDEVHVTADELLDVRSTPGGVTEQGLRSNISVGIRYIETWLRGQGAVGINNMMEDAATAEISRCQVWQWLHNDIQLSNIELSNIELSDIELSDADRPRVTRALVEQVIDEEVAAIREQVGAEAFEAGRWADARTLFTELALADELADFLTVPAYEQMP